VAWPARHRSSYVFGLPAVFTTVFLDVLCAGIVTPVLPQLLAQVGAGRADPVLWLGYLGMLFSLSQMLALPLLGALSDRYGRRPLLLLSNIGVTAYFFCVAESATLSQLVLGRILCGVTASSFGIAYAFISDSTEGAERTRAFATMGAAYSIGLVAGPLLGGWLGEPDVRLPFHVAGWLSVANLLYGIVVLPESLPAHRRTAVTWKASNPFTALGELVTNHRLRFLTGAHLLATSAYWVIPIVFVFYARQRLDWSTAQTGGALAFLAGWGGIVQMKCAPLLIARVGARRTVIVAYLLGAAGFLGLAVASHLVVACAAIALIGAGEIAHPGLQVLLSTAVPAQRQGWLQGTVKSAASIVGMAMPVLFAFLSTTPRIGPWGSAAFVAACLFLLCACLAMAATGVAAYQGSVPDH
jgi:DHA1 family tetracycline resistance protein-like MFS transporter